MAAIETAGLAYVFTDGHPLSAITDTFDDAAQLHRVEDADARMRLDHVRRLIRGYETPYGMELLATVHWVATQEGARTVEDAFERVQSWNERKKGRYQQRHVQKAWERLTGERWIDIGPARA